MTCPLCHRLYCDHSPSERGQTHEQMMEDAYAPHCLIEGELRRVSLKEYEMHMGQKWNGPTTRSEDCGLVKKALD